MVVFDVIILALKCTGIAGSLIIDERTKRLRPARLSQVDLSIMLIFVIAFPAMATLLITLVLSDLSSLQNSISARLKQSMDTNDLIGTV